MPRGDQLSGRLERYRGMRDADQTPEPFGGESAHRPGLFVVQQHAARHLHFDLRLEHNGVLWSWAVPKGPSLDPAQKHLAVRVEDHPVEYADFEGIIPEGNYGAGAVILWDLGRWIPVEDPEEGIERGKLLFDLEGFKLGGRFTLVRTRGRDRNGDGREWLLIKKPDAWAETDVPLADGSILSGLSVTELRDGAPRFDTLAREIEAREPRRHRLAIDAVKPMLAEPIAEAFDDPDWLFEVKYDGYRMLGARDDGKGVLRTRNGRPAETRFPEIAHALSRLPVDHVVLDGEIVATDREGRPDFGRLQRRAMLDRPRDIARARVENPVRYFVFDLLAFGPFDLRALPLRQRRAWLEALIPAQGPVRLAPSFAAEGTRVLAQIEQLGLEGLVAKRADAAYRAGRSADWRKLRLLQADDFVVVGFTAPRGGRTGFGALHLASHVDGELRYFGRVGTGFGEEELTRLRADLDALRVDAPPCTGRVPETRGHTWVRPELVGEVRFAEVTSDGLLRQPSWLGLRNDKSPGECVRSGDAALPALEAPSPAAATVTPGDVRFTNLEKVFWPESGATKGDLIDYYRKVGPWILPYLRDRPLVMTRYPDGIEGKSFFQKDAPEWVPDWVRTEQMWSEHAEREVNYFVCDDLASLLYVANMGTIPLHVWSSRVADLQRPDWCILDLDPKGADFSDVVAVAKVVHALCEEIGLPSFPKTSGSTGLHVLVPLGGQLGYEQSRMLAELLARVVVQRLPERATVTRRVRSREGKVYVDFLQNGHGRLLVGPFSVRPLPGAPVSMPLRWDEVNGRLRAQRYTMSNALARLRRLSEDPLAAVLHTTADVTGALARLAEVR
ncbi:MAG: DNA ligase D [Myxococcota bacterium]